ncbi:MAG: transcription antitermination factor NusB [Mogibacterium sp.]|nr:transcription antitermination factor NusB [Mogibacterium sp.]
MTTEELVAEEKNTEEPTREEIREMTMHVIYQMESNRTFDLSQISVMDEDRSVLTSDRALRTLTALTEHIGEIDHILADNLDGWVVNRLPKADLAILRLSICEMLYMEDIPTAVSINEAVELAKKYGEDKSYAFINSVLGKISRSIG